MEFNNSKLLQSFLRGSVQVVSVPNRMLNGSYSECCVASSGFESCQLLSVDMYECRLTIYVGTSVQLRE